MVYFANNVDLPMPNGDKVTPDKAPWVLIGGSYSGGYVLVQGERVLMSAVRIGALTSWTMVKYDPGITLIVDISLTAIDP